MILINRHSYVSPLKRYLLNNLRKKGFRDQWVDEVRYKLEVDREVRRGGGLIDLNIPISLPKQIEWLIGDGEETRLTVSGKEKITVGGISRWCANCPVTEGRPKQQKFPDLDMEQQLSVNLQGNIGEKIHVRIDHSSRGGGLQAVNKVSLRYVGLEDEIIKSIDMGDTDLTLSGANLVSQSGGSKGLFGVKVQAQIGPADLTVIASKEEGENASVSFSGSGGQSSNFVIYDSNYRLRNTALKGCGRSPRAGFVKIAGHVAVVWQDRIAPVVERHVTPEHATTNARTMRQVVRVAG